MVAVADGVSQELYDVVGTSPGGRSSPAGVHEASMVMPAFVEFALGMAREGALLCAAPPLPTSDGDVTVVTDPHYNTLLSHEIIGHPVELDRALKMETAYAGRSRPLARPRRPPDRQARAPPS